MSQRHGDSSEEEGAECERALDRLEAGAPILPDSDYSDRETDSVGDRQELPVEYGSSRGGKDSGLAT